MPGVFRLSARIGRPSLSVMSKKPYRSSSTQAERKSGLLPVCAKNKMSLCESPTTGHSQSKAVFAENRADPPYKKTVIMQCNREFNEVTSASPPQTFDTGRSGFPSLACCRFWRIKGIWPLATSLAQRISQAAFRLRQQVGPLPVRVRVPGRALARAPAWPLSPAG